MVGFSETDVAIIGAGPYGLSLAAHIGARGIDHRIFGRPMHAWSSMSPGMFLKSRTFATTIFAPQPHSDFLQYSKDHGLELDEPSLIADFAEYGVWAQKQFVSYLEETNVVGLRRRDGMFELTLATGELVHACRVVNAIGLTYFERLPDELKGLPVGLASHTAQHSDFSPFKGKRVVVVGAGQSAMQAAALLHEHQADVEMYVRGEGLEFGHRGPTQERSLRQRVNYPMSVLGHGRTNWVLQHAPAFIHHLPEERRIRFTQTHLGPHGAWWLRDRVQDRFPVHACHSLREATRQNSGVMLRFCRADGAERTIQADHIIAGTGYSVDVDAVSYLDSHLAGSVQRIVRAPRLSRHFETSVPGLYFIGPSSAFSFGPLYRFVAGAKYTTQVVANHLAHTRARVGWPLLQQLYRESNP
ncbi:MAG: hypothetical protein NVSMB52_10740 [Chloroflexota bacterium]